MGTSDKNSDRRFPVGTSRFPDQTGLPQPSSSIHTMDATIPARNGSATPNGSLRIALLGLAMFGFMALWSNMRGDLPVPEVTLSKAASRIHPTAAREACHTVWRRTCIRYQPLCAELAIQIQYVRREIVDFHARVELRRLLTRRPHRSLNLYAVRALSRVDLQMAKSEIVRLVDRAEQQLRTAAADSFHAILNESADRIQSLRLNLPRISREDRNDTTTR